MNYITERLIEQISRKEYRRKKAVFLAGRIKKGNQSPGFDWDKAVKGFSGQFNEERLVVRNRESKQYPEHPIDDIEWIPLIIFFSEQPYNEELK